MKYLLALFILVHGGIHLMGFAKAFGYGNITQLTKDISRTAGMFWIAVAILFLLSAFMLLFKKEIWPVVTIIAAIISQVLILTAWKDAKFGTIANILIVLVTIPAWSSIRFELRFRKDVTSLLTNTTTVGNDVVTDADLHHLPEPVQQYVRVSGAVNKPKIKNFRIVFDGEMRGKGKDWFAFRSEQYNFFDEPTRLFFMKAKMFGMPVFGYHAYQEKSASMQIKLFGLFTMMEAKGPEMNRAETVTVFNDMCLMAPATLIDKRIQWEAIDNRSAKATFVNGTNKISAVLYFNENGQLVNFTSDDRLDVNEKKQFKFSTPVENYKLIDGRAVPTYGEAIWHYPEGEFVYGQFYLSKIDYNVLEFMP